MPPPLLKLNGPAKPKSTPAPPSWPTPLLTHLATVLAALEPPPAPVSKSTRLTRSYEMTDNFASYSKTAASGRRFANNASVMRSRHGNSKRGRSGRGTAAIWPRHRAPPMPPPRRSARAGRLPRCSRPRRDWRQSLMNSPMPIIRSGSFAPGSKSPTTRCRKPWPPVPTIWR